jgi:hypothetical protein
LIDAALACAMDVVTINMQLHGRMSDTLASNERLEGEPLQAMLEQVEVGGRSATCGLSGSSGWPWCW